ncbi:MAG TPA: DEAD/DEAH box helicase [Dictyobacter sp.]|nr:DEAD/DEAH box helicase [Dictyobacter sp.]
MPSFNDFSLQSATRAALEHMKITNPTQIQLEAIPALLAGHDLVGLSATGSGKTLAYGVPLVEKLAKKRVTQALVLVPTRELAVQVHSVISKLIVGRRLTTTLLVGGKPYGSQTAALREGAQIVIGTPGRIQDHLERKNLALDELRVCVLDEADQMLDSGFVPTIQTILSTTPETRQTVLFSATMPESIARLQEKFLQDPVHVSVIADDQTPSTIEQIAYQVPHEKKLAALCTLLNAMPGESSLIFGKTKYGVEKLGKQLNDLGFKVGTLHSAKSQHAREAVLTAFRHGQLQMLLATNVAARGLDIQGISQVINYELPESSEIFTHRIGRTGRMGHQGTATTLLVPSDLPKWRRIARSLGQTVQLQRLAIDENAHANVVVPVAQPERYSAQEYQQAREARVESGRNRRQFPSNRSREQFPSNWSSEQSSEPRTESDRSRRQFSSNRSREQFTPDWSHEQDNQPRTESGRNRQKFSSNRPDKQDRRGQSEFDTQKTRTKSRQSNGDSQAPARRSERTRTFVSRSSESTTTGTGRQPAGASSSRRSVSAIVSERPYGNSTKIARRTTGKPTSTGKPAKRQKVRTSARKMSV